MSLDWQPLPAAAARGAGTTPGTVRRGDLVTVVYDESCVLTVDVAGNARVWASEERPSDLRCESVYKDAVIVVQLLAGRIVLHGSAVALDGRGLCIVGASGAGKSTAAATLIDAGAELLADDVAVIGWRSGGPVLLPSESAIRLVDTEAGGRKRSLAAVALGREAVPLSTIVVMNVSGASAKPALTRLSGADAVAAVLEGGGGPKGLAIHGHDGYFLGLARIAERVDIWRLTRPSERTDPIRIGRMLVEACIDGPSVSPLAHGAERS